MTGNQCIVASGDAPKFNKPRWEKPNKLVLKLTLVTIFIYNLLFVYQLGIHYYFPNMEVSHYDFITNLYLCIIVNIAACLILYRHHRMANQVEQELARRLHSEQALRQAKRLANHVRQTAGEVAMDYESETYTTLAGSEEVRERMGRFLARDKD